MKTMMLTILIAATVTSASAITIASWTFETSVPTTAGPHTAEERVWSATATATGSHADAATVYSNPAGNGSAESFSVNRWAVGDYWQFQVSTIGFQNISVSWDQAGSSTGPRDFVFQYSTDGVSFTQLGSAYLVSLVDWSASTFHNGFSVAPDLNTIASAIANQANVYFRLVASSTTSIGGGTVAGSGTGRVDNFTVSGTLITSTVPDTGATAFLLSIPLLGLLALHRFANQNGLIPVRKSAFASVRVD